MRDYSKLTPEALRALYAALSEVDLTSTPPQQWAPDIVEWVRQETGIEPDQDEGARETRSRFETALQVLLRERTGYSLEDFEDGLLQSEYMQLAEVTACIERHRANKTGDQGKAKGGDQGQTWVKRLGVKGAKWKDLCITIAEGACLISFCSGKPIIETWATDPGFLERREGDLLKDFQDLKTLPDQHKNVVSLLRKKLQEVSGIDGDPFISEGGGTYTRRFEMNISKGDWGGVSEYSDQARGEESEEFFGDGFHIETR